MKREITININSLIDRLEIKNTTDSAENTKAFNEIEQKVMESLSRIIYNASNADLQEHAAKANSIEETINDDGILYIKTDCLKIANGDIEKAQSYLDWIITPLKNAP